MSTCNLTCCCDNQVNDTGAAALSVMTNLTTLDISCSSVSSRGLLVLQPLSSLKELNLDMCHVTDGGCKVGYQ